MELNPIAKARCHSPQVDQRHFKTQLHTLLRRHLTCTLAAPPSLPTRNKLDNPTFAFTLLKELRHLPANGDLP